VAPVSAGRHDALVLDPTSRMLEGVIVTDPETGNERLRVLDRPVTLSFAGRMYDPILTDTVNNGAPFEAPPLTPPRSGGGGGGGASGTPSRRPTPNKSNRVVPPPPDIELKRLRSVPVNASILGEIQRIRELQTDADRAVRPSQLFPNRRRPPAPSATAAASGRASTGGGGGRVGGGGGSSVVGLDDLMRGLAHNLQLRRIAIDNAADRIVEEEDAWSDEDERELDDAEMQRRETERARAKIREQLRK
jgi:hypothetical protein